jgi:hypothetical protein
VKVYNLNQRSEEWFTIRRGVPTASRFDQILTAAKGQPSTAQDKLINELVAESILPPAEGLLKPSFMSPDMEEGVKLEAEARCCYELEHAKEPLSEVGFVMHDSGLFGGSPDAIVGESGGVEIKCPNLSTHIGYVRAGVLPADYKCQVHGYLAVTGRPWWDFFSYARHAAPFHLRVVRDEFTEKLEAELFAFAVRYNEARARFNLAPIGEWKATAADADAKGGAS